MPPGARAVYAGETMRQYPADVALEQTAAPARPVLLIADWDTHLLVAVNDADLVMVCVHKPGLQIAMEEAHAFFQEMGVRYGGQSAPLPRVLEDWAPPTLNWRQVRMALLHKAMEETHGVQVHAARRLGVSVRTVRGWLAAEQ